MLKKIQFDEEFMVDYDEESGLRDDEIISYMSLFYAKVDNKVGNDDNTIPTTVCTMHCVKHLLIKTLNC